MDALTMALIGSGLGLFQDVISSDAEREQREKMLKLLYESMYSKRDMNEEENLINRMYNPEIANTANSVVTQYSGTMNPPIANYTTKLLGQRAQAVINRMSQMKDQNKNTLKQISQIEGTPYQNNIGNNMLGMGLQGLQLGMTMDQMDTTKNLTNAEISFFDKMTNFDDLKKFEKFKIPNFDDLKKFEKFKIPNFSLYSNFK